MSKAKMAAEFVKAMCLLKFPDDARAMSKHVVDWLTFADYTTGTHKYIPSDKLDDLLDLEPGSGVYGFLYFNDGSYILLTCHDGIAWWDGGDTTPELVKF